MPIIRGSTSRGAHIRALWNLLTDLIHEADRGPQAGGSARLRTYRAMLERSYGHECTGITESDISQYLAEEDGEPIPEDI